MPNDRSDEALRERLGIAEKAAQGPWKSDEIPPEMVGCRPRYIIRDGKGIVIVEDVHHFASWQTTAAHIAANSPDVVREDIEEILRLRQENKMLGYENEKLDFQRFLAEKRVKAMLAKGMEGKYVWQHNAENRWCPFNLNRLCPGIGCMAWIPKIDENGREYSDYGRCIRLIGEENNAE